ncbi:hypothetical protein [Dictyobacter formicarum]|uniref:Copper resistance protein D domain-containing protein n=1 Tax=Dictyobacter formicarum TaxID=2778368 RepID=A0ABQ3VI26_9CHLR|nr:hypothetical protein [Dictyobacter formicarum]GHO85827.1 hypothetical protein KSZ_38330 [Dictyobacter formicarum]
MSLILTWLVRFVHVTCAVAWIGGYAMIVLVIVPYIRKWPHEKLIQMTNTMLRIMTYTGTVALVAGAILVGLTRGYGAILHGEWGGLVIVGLVVAVALLGIGDSALRPALRRLKEPDSKEARKLQIWATIGLVLGLIAIAAMTRAIYASG